MVNTRFSVRLYISKEEQARFWDPQDKFLREKLAHKLAAALVSNDALFEEDSSDPYVTKLSLDCLVLSERQYQQLVVRIQQDLMRFGATSMMYPMTVEE